MSDMPSLKMVEHGNPVNWLERTVRGSMLPVFNSPEEMMYAAKAYFEWCIKNPLSRQEQSRLPGKKDDPEASKVVDIEVPRPLTKGGLAAFLGISAKRLADYATDPKYSQYHEPLEYIFTHISNQQYELAVAGVYKENIVSRGIGLAEKVDTVNTQRLEITYEDMNNED